MSDWYGRLYEEDLKGLPERCEPRVRRLVREYDVRALLDFLVDPEGRETRYYGC